MLVKIFPKNLFQQAWFFYGIVALVIAVSINWPEFTERYQVKMLNEHRPTFVELIDHQSSPTLIKANKYKKYFKYFHLVEKYAQYEPVAYNVLGYLYGYKQDFDKAEEFFLKAVHLKNFYFWPFYNLGVMYFEQGKYDEAIVALENAVQTNTQENVDMMYGSTVFRQMTYQSGFDVVLKDSLVRGRRDAYKLLIRTYIRKQQWETAGNIVQYVLQQGIELDPSIRLFVQSGILFEHQEDGKAFYLLQEMLKVNVIWPEMYQLQAEVSKRLKQEDQARLFSMKASALGQTTQPLYLHQYPFRLY